VRFLADENISNALVRALRLHQIDVVTVSDAGLLGAPDSELLKWAAGEQRLMLTRDSATMPDYAYERLVRGEPMVGVVVTRHRAPMAKVVEDLVLMAEASRPGEWDGTVVRVPL
jgi:predicted nuclease of predicted toxin-antitoxin system